MMSRASSVLTLLVMVAPVFAADKVTDKVAITVQSVRVSDSGVNLDTDIDGKPGAMFCFRTVSQCVVPTVGRYWIAPVENGEYQDVVADVGLYAESSDPRKDKPLGVYGVSLPEDDALFSCPVTLSNVVTQSADVPYATMSIENTTSRAVAEVKIRSASVDRVGMTTVGARSFSVDQPIEPRQSARFSTLNFGDEVEAHRKASNGVGVVYFVQEVKFADGTMWAMPPGVSWCRAMDEDASKRLVLDSGHD